MTKTSAERVLAHPQPLLGSEKARLHSPLLETKSKADQVIELADKIGMPLLPWQKWICQDLLSVDDDGMFIKKSSLLLVARQSGKTHLARMLILAHLYCFDSKNVLMMAQNRAMALTTFREIAFIVEAHSFLKEKTRSIRFANGSESIELKNGHRLDVVAATRDGSRGRTADFLYIDELREIQEDAFRAATPTTRARPNAQALFTSNAGDAFSTVLNNMRENALANPPRSFGFYEYSANPYTKIDFSEKFWRNVAMANPALGHTITKEALEEAIGTSSPEATRTELLCQWIDSLQSPWPYGVLEATSDKTLKLSQGVYTVFGFDVSPSRKNASLVAGQLMPDGKIGIGILEMWSSQLSVDDVKVAAGIKKWADHFNPRQICYDKYATASIADRLSHAGQNCVDISGSQFYTACADFLDGLVNDRIVHNGQDEFIQQMNNVAAKTNDSGWRIVKRQSAGDISAPISAAMIVHELLKPLSVPQIIAG
jgi:phage terminase large subunit-like protein